MKEEFLNFVRTLMGLNPEVAISDGAAAYMEALEKDSTPEKVAITENGKEILAYLKTVDTPLKSADIALGMGKASKSVSGAMRKLVTEGYVEKIGDKSASYIITQKGKDFN